MCGAVLCTRFLVGAFLILSSRYSSVSYAKFLSCGTQHYISANELLYIPRHKRETSLRSWNQRSQLIPFLMWATAPENDVIKVEKRLPLEAKAATSTRSAEGGMLLRRQVGHWVGGSSRTKRTKLWRVRSTPIPERHTSGSQAPRDGLPTWQPWVTSHEYGSRGLPPASPLLGLWYFMSFFCRLVYR